jgi:hypothetical protein
MLGFLSWKRKAPTVKKWLLPRICLKAQLSWQNKNLCTCYEGLSDKPNSDEILVLRLPLSLLTFAAEGLGDSEGFGSATASFIKNEIQRSEKVSEDVGEIL